MAENENKPVRTLEPGTIERTRGNIGPIDAAEAIELQKKLGGEVLKERVVPIPESSMPRRTVRREVVRTSGFSSADLSTRSGTINSFSSSTQTKTVGQVMNTNAKKKTTSEDLPPFTSKELKYMDNLMMSSEYEIKPNYGLLNLFFRMSSKNREKVSKTFGEYIVKRHVEHIQAFTSTIKTFIQISPDKYKSKIASQEDTKFRFLRTVGKWSLRDIKLTAIDVENDANNLTVSKLIPLVKAVYHEVLTINYIGDQQVPRLIKEVYNDLILYPDCDKNKIQLLAKQGITEWVYINGQIIKGMYPLLMRMCGTECMEFPRFYTAQIAQILKFLGLTKFALLLPEKKKTEEEKKPVEKAKPVEKKVMGQKDAVVQMGLKMLEQLFPKAGFSNLDSLPDMYPYFQPLYNFQDGFNMLHEHNPLQVTIVLIRIIEDLFQGCRNINFNIAADENLSALNDDLNKAMNEWAFYHEELFDKKLGDYLRDYVNSIYSQKDYASSQYGLGNLNNILWRVKYYFHPNFHFNAPILTKPINDSKYNPMYMRTDYLRTVFNTLVKRIDENKASKKTVLGVMNPWERYKFGLPNIISRRLDVLLGAKRADDKTQATNANLIKYTYCIIAVLDWWINNPGSPAYTANPALLYRISDKDGQPEFSVPVMTNQNQLFADSVKAMISGGAK